MRLTFEKIEQLNSVFEFHKPCGWNRLGVCCSPDYEAYEQERSRAFKVWFDTPSEKSPPRLPPTVQCEKCEYSDKDLGIFEGNVNQMTIGYFHDGMVLIPPRGRKKVQLHNVNAKKINDVLKEISPDIEALAISDSPVLSDFSFIENFKKLKNVDLYWSNKAEKLWDFSKTPGIEFLRLRDFNRLSDISQLRDAVNLRRLYISSNGVLSSIKPLANLSQLEFIDLEVKVGDMDILPAIALPALKSFHCLYNIFDAEAYATFEAQRPDVDVSFFDGMLKWWDFSEAEEAVKNGSDSSDFTAWFVGRGKGSANYGDNAKFKKHYESYLPMKEKYLVEDYVPIIKAPSASPVEGWKQSLAEGIELHTYEEICEIEKILTDYASRMSVSSAKGQAKNVLKDTVKKITEFNVRTEFIETEEKQEIYDFLSGYFKEKWFDEFNELLEEADW